MPDSDSPTTALTIITAILASAVAVLLVLTIIIVIFIIIMCAAYRNRSQSRKQSQSTRLPQTETTQISMISALKAIACPRRQSIDDEVTYETMTRGSCIHTQGNLVSKSDHKAQRKIESIDNAMYEISSVPFSMRNGVVTNMCSDGAASYEPISQLVHTSATEVPQTEDLQNMPVYESPSAKPSPSKDFDIDSEKYMVMQDLETPPGSENFIMDWNNSYDYI